MFNRKKKPLSDDPFSNDAIRKFLESFKDRGEWLNYETHGALMIKISDIRAESEVMADFLIRYLVRGKRKKIGEFYYTRPSSKYILVTGPSIRRPTESKPAYIVRRIVEEITPT
jgi:hypothetical protein